MKNQSDSILRTQQDVEKLDLRNYKLDRQEKLQDLNSYGLLLHHVKSGARVVILSNEDHNKVFSIGFKTPPYSDTGLQHILEHSTLCGSRKYPVKDPFVELCKGSLNTFLNAITYPDKTIYPVASCNMADFRNIMDVYLDAVFYPDIYKHPEIFKQEGWHYELESADAPLQYNGVVFNEMKGVYSSPEDVLSREIFNALFPDNSYHYESGGDPQVIPELTQEEFLKYHKQYYHPSNSYIYLYGDMDVQERLDYLDREYLSAFSAGEAAVHPEIIMQQPFASPVLVQKEFAVAPEESMEHNTYLSASYVVGTSIDPELYLAMQVLDYVLVVAPGAKLKQALIDKGIGTDVDSIYESSVQQPVYTIMAKNAEASQKEAFLETIQEVLTDIAEHGIDRHMVAAGINSFEFKYREADYGNFPKGLIYDLTMMDSWLYDETKPFIHIEAGRTFQKLKEEPEGYFEELIRRYLLGNTHAACVVMEPSRTLGEEREQQERARLDAYKAGLSKQQLEELVSQTKELKAYQSEESSQEDLARIPMLQVSDIEEKPLPLHNKVCQEKETKIVWHDIFTNRIAYLNFSFNCQNVPEELLPYLGLLGETLGMMDTTHYTYTELTSEINCNSGGIKTDATVDVNDKDHTLCSIRYEIKGKVLYEKIPFLMKLVREILFETRFSDKKRLKEIIAQSRSGMESSMMTAGHTLAILSAMSQFSKTAYFSDMLKGRAYYEMIRSADDNFDACADQVVERLQQLVTFIFHKENLLFSLTADQEGYDAFASHAASFYEAIPSAQLCTQTWNFRPSRNRLGFTSSSQVQYVARCGNFEKNGHTYTGALQVLRTIFSYDYLWQNVRVKGGAYGCMSGFSKNGDCYLVSYRDPNLAETNQIYEAAADYISSFTVSKRDMDKFIIGTIGALDTPLNPAAQGSRSFTAYLTDVTYEDVCRTRREVLQADVNSIRALAPMIRDFVEQNYFCVVGGQNKIQENKELFDEIKPLIPA